MDRKQIADHLRFYSELGVTGISRDASWRARGPEERNGVTPVEKPSAGNDGPDAAAPVKPRDTTAAQPIPIARSAAEALAAIREDIGECERCKLYMQGRTQIVFGVGNPSADLMFVGEAPATRCTSRMS
jgi:DNA polymerase